MLENIQVALGKVSKHDNSVSFDLFFFLSHFPLRVIYRQPALTGGVDVWRYSQFAPEKKRMKHLFQD